jgi:hypothetical protein
MHSDKKLLGGLSFVSRTFEGRFKENPYVLDMDANLYIGPADHLSRDEHSAIEVVYHFLSQTGKVRRSLRELLRNRLQLLDAFAAFDDARKESGSEEFRIYVFGTYDGEPLQGAGDDELPAGPCGKSINELKLRFYNLCAKLDKDFQTRAMNEEQRKTEARFTAYVRRAK